MYIRSVPCYFAILQGNCPFVSTLLFFRIEGIAASCIRIIDALISIFLFFVFKWFFEKYTGPHSRLPESKSLIIKHLQGTFKAAGGHTPWFGIFISTHVTRHGFTCFRVYYRASQVTYIDAGPAPDAFFIIRSYRPVVLSTPRVHRANLDAWCFITSLADDGNIMLRMLRVFQFMYPDSGTSGIANIVMEHGAGYFTEMTPCTKVCIDKNVSAAFFQNNSL